MDFDPEVLDTWRQRGLPVFYGDVGDPELLEHLPLHRSRLVVSTVRNRDLNLDLHNALRARDYSGKVVLAARDDEEAQDFLTAGADMVLRPYSDAAEQAADSLTAALHVFTHRNAPRPLPHWAQVFDSALPATVGMEIPEGSLVQSSAPTRTGTG